jgi:hypothetical protein
MRYHATTAAEGDAHLQGASEVDHFALHRRQGPLQLGYRPHLQVRWFFSTDRRHDADRFCRCWNVVRWNKQGFTTAMPHLTQRSAQDLALDTEERVRLVGTLSLTTLASVMTTSATALRRWKPRYSCGSSCFTRAKLESRALAHLLP